MRIVQLEFDNADFFSSDMAVTRCGAKSCVDGIVAIDPLMAAMQSVTRYKQHAIYREFDRKFRFS